MDINLYAPINSLGYGVVGFNVFKTLKEKFNNITLWPIGGNIHLPCNDQAIIADIRESINKQNYFNLDLPCLKIWHEDHLAERIGKGKYVVYPFFERSNLDKRRYTHLQSTDAIIVASQWAKNILEKNQIDKPVAVAPCGVDRSIFSNKTNVSQIMHKCVFFNCGKWEIRKGHDILITAFKEAFTNNEAVELLMMTENPFCTPEEKSKWESHYLDPRVKLLPRVNFQEELAAIMKNTYCGVFPARAEGWNLELLEMMSMGKFCIATNYSAHTEFCNKNNCDLIDIIEEEPMYDGKWFYPKDGTWASLNGKPFDQLVTLLRYRYEEWVKNPIGYNIYGIETAKRFSWENCVNKILEVLENDN